MWSTELVTEFDYPEVTEFDYPEVTSCSWQDVKIQLFTSQLEKKKKFALMWLFSLLPILNKMMTCVLMFLYAGHLRLPIDARAWSTSRYVFRLYTHACMHARTHAHMHTRTHAHMHTHTHTHTLTHSLTHSLTHAWTHACIHTWTCTDMPERTQTCDVFLSPEVWGVFFFFLLCVCLDLGISEAFTSCLSCLQQICLSISVILSGVTWRDCECCRLTSVVHCLSCHFGCGIHFFVVMCVGWFWY